MKSSSHVKSGFASCIIPDKNEPNFALRVDDVKFGTFMKNIKDQKVARARSAVELEIYMKGKCSKEQLVNSGNSKKN